MGQVLGSPGADNLRAAAPLVAQIVLQSSILARHMIADPALSRAGREQIGSGETGPRRVFLVDAPHVGAPEVSPVARRHTPNEVFALD
jgi:hypothetical protein